MAKEKKDEKKEVEVPSKFKKMVEEIEKMSVLELSELVSVLEDKFGVSAAAPAMNACATGPSEQNSFSATVRGRIARSGTLGRGPP